MTPQASDAEGPDPHAEIEHYKLFKTADDPSTTKYGESYRMGMRSAYWIWPNAHPAIQVEWACDATLSGGA